MNLVTIVPVESAAGEVTRTQGTRVLLADGSELHGVTRIVLTADVNDVWRAQIDLRCRVEQMQGVLAQIDATAIPESDPNPLKYGVAGEYGE